MRWIVWHRAPGTQRWCDCTTLDTLQAANDLCICWAIWGHEVNFREIAA